MKPTTVAVICFFLIAMGGPLLLGACSGSSRSTVVCTDAGIDAAPVCMTTTPTGGGGGGW